MGKTYCVGTRASPLALKQVDEIVDLLREFYPDMKVEVKAIETYGDKDKTTPISEIEGTDFFTREIEDALLEDRVDFAVHSAKDLSEKIPDELCVAAITESIDPYDALVSRNKLRLNELPYGAKIGSSSSRRKTQLKLYRQDFQIIDIRGNIEERLKLLDVTENRNLDAIIIAACALKRLGLKRRITERIPFEILRPHPLQGCLAVEIRKGDKELLNLLSCLTCNNAFV